MRSILLWGVVIIFVFYGINILRRSADAKVSDNSTLLDFIAMYILSPPVAFEQVQEKLTPQFGSRTFAFFYAVASKLGFGKFVIEPKLQEFVYVPIQTNVYTVFQPFSKILVTKELLSLPQFMELSQVGCTNKQKWRSHFKMYVHIYCRNFNTAVFQENLILSLSLLFQYLIVFTFILQKKIKFVVRA